MQKLTGYAAISFATEHSLDLNKFADPTEGARSGLSLEEALEIAEIDAELIWVSIAPTTESA